MKGCFVASVGVEREQLVWGVPRWFSRPSRPNAQTLMLVEVTLEPGFGHTFHRHPEQEEIVFVLEGEIQQYIETDKRTLRLGDSDFMKRRTVHDSSKSAKLLAIVGPCRDIGDDGYDLIEAADEAPWNILRQHVAERD